MAELTENNKSEHADESLELSANYQRASLLTGKNRPDRHFRKGIVGKGSSKGNTVPFQSTVFGRGFPRCMPG